MKHLAITVDGRTYEVEGEGKNLLQVCLSLGFNLPYFCWHPALHSVGACRQCAVKVFRTPRTPGADRDVLHDPRDRRDARFGG